MTTVPHVLAAVAVLLALVAAAAARHLYRLRQALLAEQAARRLAGVAHHQDLEAFRARLTAVLTAEEVLAEADTVLDTALAAHHRPKGGPTA